MGHVENALETVEQIGADVGAKAPLVHTHVADDVTDFDTSVDGRITAARGVTLQAYDAGLTPWGAKTAPTGTVVGTTDTQTLSSKTLTAPIISTIINSGTITLPASTTTLVGRDTTDTLTNKDLSSGTNTFPTLNQNTTGSAAKWTTARTIALTGDVTWSQSVDGSANVSGAATLATVNSNTGSFGGAATVATFSVNGKGLITSAGSTAIAIAGSAITSGTVAAARLGSGSSITTKFLRGDSTWVAPTLATMAPDVTASAAELNILDGATLSTAELNYLDGVTSAIQAQLDDKRAKTRTGNAETGTTYTLALTDAENIVTLNNAAAVTVTVPPNSSVAYPVWTTIDFIQTGAGQVTFAEGTGVTIHSADSNKKIAIQYGGASLVKIGTNTWVLLGRLTA